MKDLIQNKRLLIGGSFILLLLVSSVVYTIFLDKNITPPPNAIYGEDHRLLDVPPYPPSVNYPLGVDRHGEDILWKVIDGAKYTILIALIVSAIRIGISLFGSIFFVMFLPRLTFLINSFIRAFRFVPGVFLAYIFFVTLKSNPDIQNLNLIAQQILVLGLIGGIPLTGHLAAELNQFLKKDFISCSHSLGASKSWLIRKHILNYLKPRLMILFTQQVVQSLLILVHLGVFQMIIGKVKTLKMMDGITSADSVTLSLSNEWSGLLGLSYRELMLDQWIVLGPSLAFIFTIYSFRLIGKGLEKTFEKPEPKKVPLEREALMVGSTDNPFSLVNRNDNQLDT
ncbi:ABC transporter permease subunit [Rossellomorea aquimaris]|uniref:ABC transporter permease subunit n=1 Tax=Rossellomorea aquimaris TaxID=189382 RepID=UPI003CEA1334